VRIAYKRGLPGVVACCGVGAMIYGVGYLFVSWSTALIFAAFGAFLAHLGGGMQWSSVIFGIAKTAPDEVRGRIGAADFALVTFSMSARFHHPRVGAGAVGLGCIVLVPHPRAACRICACGRTTPNRSGPIICPLTI
jgi:hypothetical protein